VASPDEKASEKEKILKEGEKDGQQNSNNTTSELHSLNNPGPVGGGKKHDVGSHRRRRCKTDLEFLPRPKSASTSNCVAKSSKRGTHPLVGSWRIAGKGLRI